jgi:hypothetical protein
MAEVTVLMLTRLMSVVFGYRRCYLVGIEKEMEGMELAARLNRNG